jgi:hypothetical protein
VTAPTAGALRLSKGAWLFAPDGVDVLLHVTPQPPPSTDGFLSRTVQARLQLRAKALRPAKPDAASVIQPRTGVPAVVVGRVVDVDGAGCVVDAGVAFVVVGVVAAVGSVVEVDVDVDAGVVCGLG